MLREFLSDLSLNIAIDGYQKQPDIIAEKRTVIRDRKGKPVEFVLTGYPNDDVLAKTPPSRLGNPSLPLVLVLGQGTLSEKQENERLEELEKTLLRHNDVSSVRIVNEQKREVRYLATGIPRKA